MVGQLQLDETVLIPRRPTAISKGKNAVFKTYFEVDQDGGGKVIPVGANRAEGTGTCAT